MADFPQPWMKKTYFYARRAIQAIKLILLALSTKGVGLSYVVESFTAILKDKRSIWYLGSVFYYEDRLNPFSIFDYVNEIRDASLICKFQGGRVLDVGGNVGIYGYTVVSLFPGTEVFSFEPNPVPFEYLEKNAKPHPNWKVFNQGISDRYEVKDIHFVEGKTGQGSFYRENADLDLAFGGDILSLPVRIGPLPPSFLNDTLGGTHFDFVKIDTEGYESIVIKGLADITWKFMYVELSQGRAGQVSLDGFIGEVRSLWPSAQLLKSVDRGVFTDVWLRSS